MTGRLFTTRELADQFGVTPETILRYVRAGELRGIRLPGTVRGRLRFDRPTSTHGSPSMQRRYRPEKRQQPKPAPPTGGYPRLRQQPRP